MKTKIVNRRRAGYDVFIGRPGPWGNPFREGRDGTRAEVIAKYEIWLRAQLKCPAFAVSFDALRGKTLGCYCKPKACHGDVMLKVLEERAAAPAPFTPWPADQLPRYNACTNQCDMWNGPCACGAWHTEGR